MFTPTFYSPNIYIIHTFFSILKWLLNRATKKVQILLKNVVLEAPSGKEEKRRKDQLETVCSKFSKALSKRKRRV